MIPKTPAELYTVLWRGIVARLYGDVTLAARRGRLTEADIAAIERDVLAVFREAVDMAREIEGYEVEPVTAAVLREMKELLDILRAQRAREVAKKP